MGSKIKASELFEKEDIFEGIRRSAEKTMVTLGKIDAEFTKIGATLKGDISKAKIGGAKELKEFMALVEKANNLQTNTIKLEKEKAIAEQQNEKLKQQKIRTQSAENREQEKINKQKQKAIKLAKDESSAYKKLVVATRDLKNQSKDLGAQMLMLEQSGKKNTTQYHKLEQQYKRVSKSAQNGDAQLKKLDKTVGDNFRNVGNYTGALNTLKTGLAQLGLAFGIGQVVRGGMEAILEFDQAIADLSAITGASGKDLQFFKKQANELGIEVEGGASAVVEAYKLIGSARPELLENAQALNEVTKSAILLSQASGLELPEASQKLTSALNQFQAPAEEAGRYINVLANGAKFGSAEIPEIADALLKFGGVAKGFNVSIEESVALVELLRPSFKESAEVGTALRNIMLKMSAPEGTPKLAKAFAQAGIDVKAMTDETKSFEERARALLPLLEDNNMMVKVFGAENVVGAKALLTQVDAMDDMESKMHTLGTVQEQANTRTNTLSHSLMELKNSFFALFTQMGSGEGSMQWLIDSMVWLKDNLPQVVSVLYRLIRAFVIYKTTMLALRTAQRLYITDFSKMGKEFVKQIPLTRAYRLEQIKLARASRGGADAIKGGTKAVNGFGKAFASIGIFLIITAVTELAMAFYNASSGANALAEAEKKLEHQREVSAKAENKQNASNTALDSKRRAEFDNSITQLEKKMRLGKLDATTERQKRKLELQFLKDKKKLVDEVVVEDRLMIDEAKENFIEAMKLSTIIRKKGTISSTRFTLGGTDQGVVSAKASRQQQADQASAMMTSAENEEKFIRARWIENKKLVEELELEILEFDVNVKKSNKSVQPIKPTPTDVAKTYNTTLKETNDYISRQIELQQELIEIEQERELLTAQKGIDAEFERQLKLFEETGKFEVETLNELIQNKVDLEKGFIDERVQYEMDAVDRKIAQTEQKEKDSLIKERDRLLAQKDITQDAIDKINVDFNKKDDELVDEQLKRRKDSETEKVVIYEEGVNDKIEVEENGMAEILEKEETLTEKLKGQDKKRAETTEAFVKATADYFIKQSNKKIEQLNKEISQAEKQADILQGLAENGNIDAKESLAEQQKIIADANRKKEAEQKRQQRIQLASSVYSTYSSKIASKSKNPLAETIRDTTVLQQFIASLPTFEDGVDDTGTNGRGIDGKGGFLSVLHPNERVVPKSLNEQIGGLTNNELSQMAMEYQNGKMVRSDSQMGSALELSVLVNRLDTLTKVIQDKPETNIELGEITQSAMEIVKSTKRGNTHTFNRYKVK